MERLIVEIQYGDGFTYSAEDHLPAIFSSKEEFIISLEDKVKQVQEQLNSHAKLVADGQEKLQAKLQQMRKVKNPTKKEEEKFQEELRELMVANSQLSTQETQMHSFMLGGQTFHISNFLEESYENNKKTQYIRLPQVWTVDEYFAEVEINAAQSK